MPTQFGRGPNFWSRDGIRASGGLAVVERLEFLPQQHRALSERTASIASSAPRSGGITVSSSSSDARSAALRSLSGTAGSPSR